MKRSNSLYRAAAGGKAGHRSSSLTTWSSYTPGPAGSPPSERQLFGAAPGRLLACHACKHAEILILGEWRRLEVDELPTRDIRLDPGRVLTPFHMPPRVPGFTIPCINDDEAIGNIEEGVH